MTVARDNEAADRRRKGLALKAVRRRLGFTQETAAQAYKVTIQAWQNYEAGKRHLSDPKIRDLLAALNSDREEFDLELARIPEDAPAAPSRQSGMEERSYADAFQIPVAGVAHGGPLAPDLYQEATAEVIDLARFFAPGTLVLKLSGMSMYPYAEAGGWVSYNPNQPARRGHGCVVEMKDGSKLVKRFDGYTDNELLLTELWPEERQIRLDLADVKGVYAIGVRGE
ncbi:helix-turn-helix domain-containing protein [Brevundimonas staleyi]|uniref:Helix-turn-helix domain-containing protein n=1 Tax=Brevundimonas staleyi TaxID=74326 RepID=A0ABW0FXN0_9CAUL